MRKQYRIEKIDSSHRTIWDLYEGYTWIGRFWKKKHADTMKRAMKKEDESE